LFDVDPLLLGRARRRRRRLQEAIDRHQDNEQHQQRPQRDQREEDNPGQAAPAAGNEIAKPFEQAGRVHVCLLVMGGVVRASRANRAYNGLGFRPRNQEPKEKGAPGMLALLMTCAALAAEPADWQKEEATYLKNIKQLTTDFARAGEGYFSPDGKKIIFQA